MPLIFKYIFTSLFVALIALILVFAFIGLLSEIDLHSKSRYSRRDKRMRRKFKKALSTSTDYPHIPLTMVTKHFGWSYEYEKYHGWNYFIWYVRDDGTTVSVNSFNDGSRQTAIDDCRKLESHFHGGAQ